MNSRCANEGGNGGWKEPCRGALFARGVDQTHHIRQEGIKGTSSHIVIDDGERNGRQKGIVTGAYLLEGLFR